MLDTMMSLKYSYENYKIVLWISLLPLCLSDIGQGLKWLSNDLHYNKIKLIINTDLKESIGFWSCLITMKNLVIFFFNLTEKNKITQLSEENSINVLTHFKNKKNKQKQSAKRHTSWQAGSLIFQSMHICNINTTANTVTQDHHMLTLLSMLLSCKCRYSTK